MKLVSTNRAPMSCSLFKLEACLILHFFVSAVMASGSSLSSCASLPTVVSDRELADNGTSVVSSVSCASSLGFQRSLASVCLCVINILPVRCCLWWYRI
ncbi:hypothetical protein EDB19DRAFT_1676951 [Suillus lakei]|nr:hypothetical protein EDB19DRAFT_1676951 [Suillus lakei]